MKKNAIKFFFLGVFAFLIDYSLTLTFHYFLAVPGYVASAISFTISFLFSFTLSRRWVFRSQAGYRYAKKVQTLMYLSLAVINLGISTGLIAYLSSVHIEVYLSKALSVALIATWNFFLSHYIIFSKEKTD